MLESRQFTSDRVMAHAAAPTTDRDLTSIQEARQLARAARAAQATLAEFSQEQVDGVIDAMAAAVGPEAETLARLEVQIAIAQLEAARASEAVGRAAADSARESRRIIRDRYESGLADVAMLLRSDEAVQQADLQQVGARVNVLTATATLQRAIGRP